MAMEDAPLLCFSFTDLYNMYTLLLLYTLECNVMLRMMYGAID